VHGLAALAVSKCTAALRVDPDWPRPVLTTFTAGRVLWCRHLLCRVNARSTFEKSPGPTPTAGLVSSAGMSHPRQKYAEMCRNRVFTIDRSGGALMVAFPAISRWLAGESLESEPESTLRADVVTFACTTAMCAVFFGAGAAT
jgi:hypothetical protein